MKNFDAHVQRIRAKAQKIKRRRTIIVSTSAVMICALMLTLFLPYSRELPSVKKYENSPYFDLIDDLNKATYQPPKHKNNYEALKSVLSGMKNMPATEMVPTTGVLTSGTGLLYGSADMAMPESTNGQQYTEVTDNQVAGVIEGDLFKRSDRYVYYLRNTELSVYSIAQSESLLITTIEVFPEFYGSTDMWFSGGEHLYLSSDCGTLTVVSMAYHRSTGAMIMVTTLDVSDPRNIVRHEPLYFSGSSVSSRMVDDDLLLIYNHSISQEIDFDNPETFVPTYGTLDNMLPVDADSIFCPAEDPTSARYTVVAKVDTKNLQVLDMTALLSYSLQVYVSENTIYATYNSEKTTKEGDKTHGTMVTEITGVSYRGEALDVLGTVTVNGTVKDQYSMDQYNGVLRVATSTLEQTYRQYQSEYWIYRWREILSSERNCDLYCIDLNTWEIASSVIGFAPEGEEVTSARFNGNNAYICTAEVVILSDPVYFFDLQDIHNITYKHTPVIDGYSSSLIQFGDYLVGIGYNDQRDLKVEAYAETATEVIPIAAYERDAIFTEEYKAYLIDREQGLIGLHVTDWSSAGNRIYLLLWFDGEQFHELEVVTHPTVLDCRLGSTRAFVEDNFLYIFTYNGFLCWPL